MDLKAEKKPLPHWINASDLASYVVCPEAWRLKFLGQGERQENTRANESQAVRANWVKNQDLSRALRRYARVSGILLVMLTGLAFYLEFNRSDYLQFLWKTQQSPHKASFQVPSELLFLLLILGLVIFMWDLFDRRRTVLQKSIGIQDKAVTIAVKGSSSNPGRQLVSSSSAIRSKPDAIIREDNNLIPMDIHPLSDKVRDRHVVQMLTHLRLMQELENFRPPHGILLMGKNQRRVELKNTEEKQRWLQSLIDEMRSIIEGIPAMAKPSAKKCKSCDVRHLCEFAINNKNKKVNH